MKKVYEKVATIRKEQERWRKHGEFEIEPNKF